MQHDSDSPATEHHGCCSICGGRIIGDGYTLPRHCENVELPLDVEMDCNVILCEKPVTRN